MFTEALTFDDVLLVPQYSEIASRSDCDTSTNLGKGIVLKKPFISANMKTVTGPIMAATMADFGAMGILHRFASIQEQIEMYNEAWKSSTCTNVRNHIGVSVGIKSKEDSNILLSETGAKIVCVDVAHGDHVDVVKTVEYLAGKFPEVLLIAGNVATASGALRLANAGADVIKVGIGSGSICSTRIETGNGVPQLSALIEVSSSLKNTNVKIISDGGVKQAGNAVKALCYSHAVMLGSMFSATDEAPGEAVMIDGQLCMLYAGSSTHKSTHIEGVSGYVKTKGSVVHILNTLTDGLTSGMSYQNSRTLEDLRDMPQFVKITNAGLFESKTHQAFVR